MEVTLEMIQKAKKDYDLSAQLMLALLFAYKEGLHSLVYFGVEIVNELYSKKLMTASKAPSAEGVRICEDLLGVKYEEGAFEEFWKTFPDSDELSPFHLPTRKMRVKKVKCRKEYGKLLKDGVKHSSIIAGLKSQIQAAINKSTSTRNELTFMKNSDNWLIDRDFEVWASKAVTSNTPTQPLPNVK